VTWIIASDNRGFQPDRHNVSASHAGQRAPTFLSVARRIKIFKARSRRWDRSVARGLHPCGNRKCTPCGRAGAVRLNERIEDILARAAVTLGNGTDEYLERDARDSHHQDLFSAEISNGQRHLKELATEITYFKFLKTATLSRFPDFKPPRAE
jgi:hypothetical protein